MVIFFFSLCLLLRLLLVLLLHLSCPARQQGCLLPRLVLIGTDVNIHPIPHFQKSFPLKPTPLSLSPAQHFACQSPPSSLLRSFVPCSLSIKPPHFMDNLINSVPLSTKSPVFMDKRQIFYDLSMKPPHFMDKWAPHCSQLNVSSLTMDKNPLTAHV